MSNLYIIKGQRTHNGKTASEYLNGAHVATARAGNTGVVSPALPGCWLILTETDDMVIDGLDHGPVRLLCSTAAAETLRALTDEADAIMLAEERIALGL